MAFARGVLSLMVTAAALPALAVSPETAQWEAQYNQQLVAHARQLAASRQAEDLYLAARLTTAAGIDPATGAQDPSLKHSREQWLQQAFAAPGDSVMVARAALGNCSTDAACAKARAHWQALDVADAATWLMPNADGEISEAAWAAAAAAGRYLSDYELELPALLKAAADWELPAPPAGIPGIETEAPATGRDMLAVAAVATLAATLDLPMKALDQCKAAAADSLRQRQCRSILEKMADSQTLVQSSVGTGLRAQLATDPADQQHWQQRRRELAWLTEQGAGVTNRQPVWVFLQQVSEQGERATLSGLLVAAGIAPKPPAEWQSQYGGAKAR